MISNLEKLYKDLNLVGKNEFIEFHNNYNGLYNEVSLRYKNALDEMKPSAMFCMNKEPFILFFDLENENNYQEKIESIQKQTWNFDKAPIIVVSTVNEIIFYNAFDFNTDNHKLSILTKSVKDFQNFSYENLYTGKLFAKYKNKFTDKNRVNTLLFQHIINYRKALIEKGMNQSFATKLLSRIIFLKYLKDRNISINKNNDKMIEESFENQDSLYNLFSYLKKEFNGDLFDIEDNEKSLLSNEYMNILKNFFNDNDINGQLHLFIPFDFSIIPIELISSIYENFLNYKQYENKAYYTPTFLVDYMINSTINPYLNNAKKQNSDCKVLDPACGSGIFLIEALRKIIHKEEQIIKNKISSKRLKELIENNIFGIDKDEDAINIAIFSLYITLLDYQEPRSILNFKFPHLKNNNFFASDFFDENNCFNKKIKDIDFILSNPPYGDIKKDLHNGWYKKNNIPVNDNQIAQSFLVKVKDFCSSHTTVSMVVTSKILYNINAKKFRQYFLDNFQLKQVLELSPVRKQIFNEAVPPVAIITYKSKVETNNSFTHISIKPNLYFKYFRILLIEKNDIKYIKQNTLLKYDWLWKVLLYGSVLDFYFIKRIIEEYPKLNKWEKDIIGGEGIQFGGGSKQPAKYLEGYKFLDTKKKHLEKFYVNYQGTTPFHADYLHRNKYNNKEIFEAPALLLKKGNADDFSCISAVSTERLVFTHSISSIKFKDKNIDKLYSLCGILNSDFYTYFLFNTASSVGVERNQVHFAEYLKTPFVCNIELSSIVKNLHNTKPSNKEILLNNLNNKINQIFEINKNEIDLIDYAINISIPIWRFGDNISKTNEPIALKYVTKAQLEEYATIFTETFSEQYKYFNVDIYNFKYCTLINFKAREEKPTEPQICFIENANLENTLKTISDSTINNISDEVFIKKDVKGFNENSFFVLKTNEYKNWHRAIARLDVNEFSNAIWEAEIELPE